VAAGLLGAIETYARLLFTECFEYGRSPERPEDLLPAATAAGLEGQAFLDALEAPAAAERHLKNLEDATAAGAFGVPSFVVEGELFWGQDRLVLLRDYLLRVREHANPSAES
jgi:2-hydroxychromene-2-carboxylate isomerase